MKQILTNTFKSLILILFSIINTAIAIFSYNRFSFFILIHPAKDYEANIITQLCILSSSNHDDNADAAYLMSNFHYLVHKCLFVMFDFSSNEYIWIISLSISYPTITLRILVLNVKVSLPVHVPIHVSFYQTQYYESWPYKLHILNTNTQKRTWHQGKWKLTSHAHINMYTLNHQTYTRPARMKQPQLNLNIIANITKDI